MSGLVCAIKEDDDLLHVNDPTKALNGAYAVQPQPRTEQGNFI